MTQFSAPAMLEAASHIRIGTVDVYATLEQAAALAAGELTLMKTKAGFSSILVDQNHDIAGHVALVPRLDLPDATDILATGGGAIEAGAHTVRPEIVIVAAVVILAAVAGTGYFVYRRRKAKAAAVESQQAAATVLADAESVVDAELATLSRTTNCTPPLQPSEAEKLS